MFEKLELKGRGKTYIGYDLGAGYGEISVFTENEPEPVTLLSRKDATISHFPCMLAKYQGRFYAGFEAASLVGTQGAVIFEDLLELAMNQTSIVANGQRFDTGHLLQSFLKLTLRLPEAYGKLEKAGGILFTTYTEEDDVTQRRVCEVLTKAVSELAGAKTRVYLQTRSESIYYFLMYQEESLYRQDVLVCDYQKDHLKTYFMKKHGNKAPFMMYTERREYPEMKILSNQEGADKSRQLDETFCELLTGVEERYKFGLSYLLGDGFKGNWLDRSLDRLCYHGRVFQGNNLYSRGACYCLRQVLKPMPVLQEYVFVSSQDIAFDVGMYCHVQGIRKESIRPQYISIFEKGTPFKACRRTLYLMPEGEKQLTLEVKALYRPQPLHIFLDISDFPNLKAGESRLKINLEFTDCRTLTVFIEDIGLGTLMPGSKKTISRTIRLDQEAKNGS